MQLYRTMQEENKN